MSYVTTIKEWKRLRRHKPTDDPWDIINNALVEAPDGILEIYGCKVLKVEHGMHPEGGSRPDPSYVEPTFYVEDGQHLCEPLDLYYAANRVNQNRLVIEGSYEPYKLGECGAKPSDFKLPRRRKVNGRMGAVRISMSK